MSEPEQVMEIKADDVCDIFCSDAVKVQRMRGEAPRAAGLGSLFKALGDETRATILYCLSREELCVCDLAQILEMTPQAVSHHLRVLRATKLVRYRREGKLVFYVLDDEHVAHLIAEGLAHVYEVR